MAVEEAAGAPTPARRARWMAVAIVVVVAVLLTAWQVLARMPRLERAELYAAGPEAVATDTGALVVTDPSDGTYDGLWTFRNAGPVPVDVTIASDQGQLYVDVHLVPVDRETLRLGPPLDGVRLAPGDLVGVAFSFDGGCGPYSAGTSFGPGLAQVTVSVLGVRRVVPADGVASVLIHTTKDIPLNTACGIRGRA